MSWDTLLDGSKIAHHPERVQAWQRGERIAPITIDMALTRQCNYGCKFCYAHLQENERHPITESVMERFLTDCAEMGVKGISFVSDGESTISPAFKFSVKRGYELGIDMAVGTNGLLFTKEWAEELLPCLTYVRVNFSGGTKSRYSEIMGVKPEFYDRVCQNIADMMAVKREKNLSVTIGMQMVLMPSMADQIIPFAELAKALRPDYAIIKHCSDDEDGSIGIDYGKYAALEGTLKEVEALSDDRTQIVVKWSKIGSEGKRQYQRCYGPPFIMQLSGSGLVAPCGMLFNDRYRKFHIGNIVQDSFKTLWQSDRYWEVMDYLASEQYNAQVSCGSLCLQHKTNEVLDSLKRGLPMRELVGSVPHQNFI